MRLATYQCLDCDNSMSIIAGETNQSLTALSNGNYAVEVTANCCTDTSACVTITTVGIVLRIYLQFILIQSLVISQ